MKIEDKTKMYEMYRQGRFGNKLRMWDTLEEVELSGYRGLFGLRYRGNGSGNRFETYIPYDKLAKRVDVWVKSGAERSRIILCEAAPHAQYGTLSAEVMRSHHYLRLFYSHDKLPMRAALANGKLAEGIKALGILRQTLDAPSMECLNELFDLYPDSVIEISSFSITLGDCSRNTIFWEVRNY